MTTSSMIGIGGITAALAVGTLLHWQSQRHVVTAGFWFHDVTFELPHLQAAGWRPLDDQEKKAIEAIAWSEVRMAFSGLRVALSDSRASLYRVFVVQQYPPFRSAGFGAAGQSRAVAGLGGQGSVNFLLLGSLALSYAPPEADRAAIVAGIGRGIGRAAVHEFAHQMLPTVPIHDSKDEHSYEYASAGRSAQFYGPMHWDTARPFLLKRLGEN